MYFQIFSRILHISKIGINSLHVKYFFINTIVKEYKKIVGEMVKNVTI